MWDLPGTGIEPVSPALAGGFLTTELLGKSTIYDLDISSSITCMNESHSVVSDSLRPHGLYSPWNSPGQNTGFGSLSLQGIFPTQGLNKDLLHCRRILYQLNHWGSTQMLEWVAYPFSRGFSRPRKRPGVSFIASRFFTNWAILTCIVGTVI